MKYGWGSWHICRKDLPRAGSSGGGPVRSSTPFLQPQERSVPAGGKRKRVRPSWPLPPTSRVDILTPLPPPACLFSVTHTQAPAAVITLHSHPLSLWAMELLPRPWAPPAIPLLPSSFPSQGVRGRGWGVGRCSQSPAPTSLTVHLGANQAAPGGDLWGSGAQGTAHVLPSPPFPSPSLPWGPGGVTKGLSGFAGPC